MKRNLTQERDYQLIFQNNIRISKIYFFYFANNRLISTKEIEQNIKKVIEFTGCDVDKVSLTSCFFDYRYFQAAVALYDNDNNVEAACIKIIDSQTEEDSWAKVEKPQKKTEIRDEKVKLNFCISGFTVFEGSEQD